MGREVSTSTGLRCSALDAIADRLSALPELYLPHSSFAGRADQQVSQQEKKDHLVSLLHRDAAIFLERYGSRLLLSELTEFECLKEDYEVNWHLKKLRAAKNPSPGEQRSRAAAVKNRRLAFLEQLVEDGNYFSEEEMRMRCPLLHHEYVGQFQEPSIWAFSRRGDKMADILIRQSEEAFIQRKMEEERKKILEVEEEEEEEEEDEEDEEDEGKTKDGEQHKNEELSDDAGTSNQRQAVPSPLPPSSDDRLQAFSQEMMAKFLAAEDKNKLSPEELQCKLDDFTRVMQEKFLSGEDSEHVDYAVIDDNAALDDHWLREVSHEAEEKYFEEEDL
ncbi:coiled-coil domain-containing protein 97 isoform X2 [Selaginella moellendorffii]|uniref:coiled-coil domain-containing protein 97 isoform X2 n=1 Tax=Selaginella moellendorffii TaxID=88036 RepID=UPI000D1CB665|nr:coiled-coil domain-containing protein 97 isoform X2 [Selaginella moellendorffii]XP_024537932.1 coiled-coil domain-containing protein 97 isoform X2 [Selaginella moellendorffii]|eukprot:XP_024521652.1 coiled-coil domain-containing protein 97 isoform X2 [Selaginella moellendorffii]